MHDLRWCCFDILESVSCNYRMIRMLRRNYRGSNRSKFNGSEGLRWLVKQYVLPSHPTNKLIPFPPHRFRTVHSNNLCGRSSDNEYLGWRCCNAFASQYIGIDIVQIWRIWDNTRIKVNIQNLINIKRGCSWHFL